MIEISLVNRRGVTLIDDGDFELVGSRKWYLHSHGYAVGPGGRTLLHRFLMNPPDGTIIDHVDGNKLNNQRANLRITGYSLNGINRHKEPKSETGVRGVTCRSANQYVGLIWKDGKPIYLGSFRTLQDAAKARLAAEIIYHGEGNPVTIEWLLVNGGG